MTDNYDLYSISPPSPRACGAGGGAGGGGNFSLVFSHGPTGVNPVEAYVNNIKLKISKR